MIIILSPAKNLIAPDIKIDCSLTSTKPIFLEEAQELISLLRSKKVDDIAKMMHLSAPLAELNVSRYQQWSKKHTIKNARPSVLTFNGAAYLGLNASTFSEEELLFSQTHLRILSGLYGLLKPLDLMQDYRLEMGTSLSNAKGNNLYQFWDDKIVQALQKDVNKQGKVLINLASNEYSKAVPFKKLKARVIHFQFKDKTAQGEYKTIMTFAKKARGLMSRFIIQNQLTNPEDLKAFDLENYLFSAKESTENDWIFMRG